jgi:hypothetical protein
MEINDIQGTARNSVNISDKNSKAYPEFAPAPGPKNMGLFPHIFLADRARLPRATAAAAGAGRRHRRAGLWRQTERKLIDRHAILAEHPLQSCRHCEIHMTITGMR